MCPYFGTFSGGGEVGLRDFGRVVCRETEPSVRSSEVLGRDEVPFLSLSFWMRLFFVTGRIASALAMRESILGNKLSQESDQGRNEVLKRERRVKRTRSSNYNSSFKNCESETPGKIWYLR